MACAIGFGAASGGARATTHTVVMEAVSFRPAVLAVRVGDSIVWVNRDPFPHTATSKRFDSRVIAAGGSWTHTVKSPGELPYVCALHPTMTATLFVK